MKPPNIIEKEIRTCFDCKFGGVIVDEHGISIGCNLYCYPTKPNNVCDRWSAIEISR